MSKGPILKFMENLPDSGLMLDHPDTVPILWQEFEKNGILVILCQQIKNLTLES